jgi:hypothetical protein
VRFCPCLSAGVRHCSSLISGKQIASR